jgi:serine protease
LKRIAVISSALSVLGIAALALMVVFHPLAADAASGGNAHSPHVMGVYNPAAAPINAAATSNLTYHGGPVETTPAVYISWWGSQWSTGFSTGGYSSATAQTYIKGFFTNVGGSSWDNIDTQYCQGVATGTVNCGTSGTHITNPTGQLKGTWTDTTSVPTSPTQSQIASAGVRLMQHFGYNKNATYFVFTPTGHSMSGFGTQWCAWHSATSSSSGEVAYAYMPYIPNAGSSCGMNFVNGTNNSYGNGYFDGFSIVGGHEYAEAMTDPHTYSGSGGYAWVDSSGAENGDKCAWSSASKNISLGGHNYAIQPIWSNAISGCATSR